MSTVPDVNNGADPNILALNPQGGAPDPIVPPEEEAPIIQAPEVKLVAPTAEIKEDDKPVAQPQNDAAAQPIYYQKIEIVEEKFPRLKFERLVTAQPPPPSVLAFRRQIEDVCRLVRILFQDNKDRLIFFKRLQTAAAAGLSDQNASIEVGLNDLQDVKNSIEDAYTDIRGKLWWSNVKLLGTAIAYCGVGTAVLKFAGGIWLWQATAGWQAWVVAALLIPLGAMAGLFIEFIFRVNDDIPYEQLQSINPGRWKPLQRAVNTSVVATIFAAILAAQIIQVGVSGVLLNELASGKPWLSVVIGFVTGFSFPYVRDLVQQVRPVAREAH